MRRILLGLIIAAQLLFGPMATAEVFSHEVFNTLLKNVVEVHGSQSAVRYKKLKGTPQQLEQYTTSLENVPKKEYQSWSKDEQLSFLINAYNAFTLKLIIEHYPLESIKDIGGFFGSPWKQEFFTLFGERRTLDYIEHDVIRKDFKEPRIHFALVCAAKSCPPLRTEAYTASKLSTQLDDQARIFLNDSARNYYDPKDTTLYLSKIFSWFAEDFTAVAPTVRAYVLRFMEDVPELPDSVNIEYLTYDWSLNDVTENG